MSRDLIKIAAVIENVANEYGGPANSLPNLLSAIDSNCDVASTIISTVENDFEKNEFISRYSIPWIKCKTLGPSKMKYSPNLKKCLRQLAGRGDFLFSNNLWNYPAYISAKVARQSKVPHIISIRGTLYPWSLAQGKIRKKIAWHVFQKEALQSASLVHVTCRSEYEAVRALGITAPIAMIPHGINSEDYLSLPSKSEAQRALELPKGKRFILFMSRLHKKKGLDILLSVWPSIAKSFPDCCLLVAGPDNANYEQKINFLKKQGNISDNLLYLGMLTGKNKLSAFSASEFFVLPTYSENFGVVVGEALAAGLPAITTTGTPWSDISRFDCGKYIELTEKTLKNAIVELLNKSDDNLSAMAENARALIKDRYGWRAQAIKFKEALNYIACGTKAHGVVFEAGESVPDSVI